MKVRTGYFRALIATSALAAVVALAGCETDGLRTARAMKELSPEMKAELAQKNMPLESPILVRLFKQESELEVWKQDAGGRYELLKTYPICRWSGELGPKIKEGDRQAPEGFYAINAGHMNPNSQFFLSINTGYPNAFDKAHQRTGAALMIHGDCSSRGCYAMTDDQISEIYALARESFFGGQRSFQLQAYPFRMTPANFARHRNNPHLAFWKMLKEGSDHFEVTRQEPKVDVCDKRYVFNAEAPANPNASSIRLGTPWGGLQEQKPASLNFSPAGKCPVYVVPEDVRDAVAAKRRTDEQQIASLIPRTTAAPIRTGRDGGMHPIFIAKLKPQEVREADGTVRYVVDENAAKKLGSYVNPPLETHPDTPPATRPAPQPKQGSPKQNPPQSGTYIVAAAESTPAPAPAPAKPQPESGNMFTSLFSSGEPKSEPRKNDGFFGRVSTSVGRLFGNDDERKPAPPAPAAKAPPAPKPRPAASHQPKPQPETAQPAPTTPPPAPSASLLPGAQPTVPAGNFDNRWGALR